MPSHDARQSRGRRASIALALAHAVAAVLATAAPSVAAQPAPACAGLAVEVVVADATPADRDTACLGARDAIAFFQDHGLKTPDRVSVRVTTRMPEGASDTAAGCLDETTGTVHVLPYDRFRAFRTWFQLPVDRAMYRSLVTHEVAHAMSGCNFAPSRPTIQAKEYVAYVAMFSAMQPAVRQRVLARYPDPGFESADRLTPLLYLFDPMRFGVECWRHHARQSDARDFLAQVLAGRAMTD